MRKTEELQNLLNVYPLLNTFYQQVFNTRTARFFVDNQTSPSALALAQRWKLKPIEGFRFPRKGFYKPALP
jgi:hypothetical protein